MKQCYRCRSVKSRGEFFRASRNRDGLEGTCKVCRVSYVKGWRHANPGKQAGYVQKHKETSPTYAADHRRNAAASRLRHPERERARQDVWSAIKGGRMARASECPCGGCGAPATSYHHLMGYAEENWLDVIPLCTSCHQAEDCED